MFVHTFQLLSVCIVNRDGFFSSFKIFNWTLIVDHWTKVSECWTHTFVFDLKSVYAPTFMNYKSTPWKAEENEPQIRLHRTVIAQNLMSAINFAVSLKTKSMESDCWSSIELIACQVVSADQTKTARISMIKQYLLSALCLHRIDWTEKESIRFESFCIFNFMQKLELAFSLGKFTIVSVED